MDRQNFKKLGIYQILQILSFMELFVDGKNLSLARNDMDICKPIQLNVYDMYGKWGNYFTKIYFLWKTISLTLSVRFNDAWNIKEMEECLEKHKKIFDSMTIKNQCKCSIYIQYSCSIEYYHTIQSIIQKKYKGLKFQNYLNNNKHHFIYRNNI